MRRLIPFTVVLVYLFIAFAGCKKEQVSEEPISVPEPGLISLAELVSAETEEEQISDPSASETTAPVKSIVPLDVDFLDDMIYLASGDRIETYANGTRSDFALCPAEKLAVSRDVIAVWGGGVYREFSKDGAELFSYPMEETVDCLCVTEHYAVFAVPFHEGHRLVRMERKNGKTEEIPGHDYGDYFFVKSLSAGSKGDEFVILVWKDPEGASVNIGSFAGVMNAKTGKLTGQYDPLVNGLASCAALNAADPDDKGIYTLSMSATPAGGYSYFTFYRFEDNKKEELTYIAATADPLLPGSGVLAGFDRMTVRGRTACLFSKRTGSVWIESLSGVVDNAQNDDSSVTLKILMDSTRIASKMKSLVIKLKEDYGFSIKTETLDSATYDEKVRVKLLAGDSDFDLFLINGQGGASLLGAVLTNGAYEPLDKYEGLSASFEGMFPYAERFCRNEKAGDELFGTPFGLAADEGIIAVDPEAGEWLDLPAPEKGWTFEEFCTLGEKYAETWKEGDPFYTHSTLLTDLMCEITQSLVDGRLQRKEAEEMEKHLVRLIQTGVIQNTNADPPQTGKVLLIRWGMIPPSGVLRENDKHDRLPMPTVAGISNIKGGGWILMNRNSKNKKSAAKLLLTLTGEDFLRDETLSTCSYVYPDYSKYISTAKLAPSERMLEQYETYGTILSNTEPYSFSFERLVQLLHIDGLWNACFTGEKKPEDFVSDVWRTMQAELFE